MFTTKDIAERLGLSVDRVNAIRYKANVKGTVVKGVSGWWLEFTKEEAEEIISYTEDAKKESKILFEVISLHKRGYSAGEIYPELSLDQATVQKCINYFEETGCVIIGSRLNNML